MLSITSTNFDTLILPHIKRGYTFKGYLPTNNEIHVCIAVNLIENDKKVIYYVYMTSKVEKSKSILKYNLKALIELDKSEYKDYFNNPSSECCIQCDKKHICAINLDDFKNYVIK